MSIRRLTGSLLRKPVLVTHIRTVFRTYSRKVLIFLYLRVQGGEQDA